MPQTLHEKLDSLGTGQVRTLDEIERSSRETSIMNRATRESLAAQTEILRTQLATLEKLNQRIGADTKEREERAEREAELAREHHAHMQALFAQSEAQHEMFRLAMVQLLDRINGR